MFKKLDVLMKSHFNSIVFVFVILAMVGLFNIIHINTVNNAQTVELEQFVKLNKSFRCVDGQLQFWQIDDTTHTVTRYKLAQGETTAIQCIVD